MSYHGLPCWYELATNDLDRAKAFYGTIFGWSVADSNTPGMTYMLATAGAAMVAGMMKAEGPQPLAWSIYFAVTDCDASVSEATSLGATVLVPPTDIPNTGRFAILADPQSATFSLLQPMSIEGSDTSRAFDQKLPGHGNWNELITPDPVKALAFYGKLLGWTQTRAMPMGPEMTYYIFAHEGVEIGGTCAMPGAAPHWKPYFGVSSAGASIKAVTAAGGKVLHGPDEVPGGAFTVQISDPQGVTLALVGPA